MIIIPMTSSKLPVLKSRINKSVSSKGRSLRSFVWEKATKTYQKFLLSFCHNTTLLEKIISYISTNAALIFFTRALSCLET